MDATVFLEAIKDISNPAMVAVLAWLAYETRRLGTVVGKLYDTVANHEARIEVLEDRSERKGK